MRIWGRCLAPSSVFCSATSSVRCWACGSAIASIGAWGSAGPSSGHPASSNRRLLPCHLRRHGPHRQGERPGHRARNTGRVQPDGQDAAGRRAAVRAQESFRQGKREDFPCARPWRSFARRAWGSGTSCASSSRSSCRPPFADGQVEVNESIWPSDELGFNDHRRQGWGSVGQSHRACPHWGGHGRGPDVHLKSNFFLR